jgi:hypothetical protein
MCGQLGVTWNPFRDKRCPDGNEGPGLVSWSANGIAWVIMDALPLRTDGPFFSRRWKFPNSFDTWMRPIRPRLG